MMFSRNKIYDSYVRTRSRYRLRTYVGVEYRFDEVNDGLEIHFQGTTTKSDWLFNFRAGISNTPRSDLGFWHMGFNIMARSVVDIVRVELHRRNVTNDVCLVGFSQGGAIAQRVGVLMGIPVISIAAPRTKFGGKRICKGVRVELVEDIVPKIPFWPYQSSIEDVITLHREKDTRGVVDTHQGYYIPLRKWLDEE